MSNKKSKGVCRKQTPASPQEKKLKDIVNAIKAYNAMYGTSDSERLYICTAMERAIDGAKAMSYWEQYSNDVATITIHELFGIGEDRQKKFCETYAKNYKMFRDLEYADIHDIGDPDKVYSTEYFERLLKAAVGKHYVPRQERYDFTIYYDGRLVSGNPQPSAPPSVSFQKATKRRH